MTDPISVSPEVYQVIFENDHVRVIDAQWWPRQKDEMHSHPQFTIYALTDFNLRAYFPDGSSKIMSGKERGITHHDPVEMHAIENMGSAYTRILIIESKK